MPLQALERFVTGELAERSFRAAQNSRWLHQRQATSFDEMTDLSKELSAKLATRATLSPLTKDLEQRTIYGTVKSRWKTHGGKAIETVYMPAPERKNLCEPK